VARESKPGLRHQHFPCTIAADWRKYVASLQPKRPNSYPGNAVPCDPQLPIRALEHRIRHQLVSEGAFSGYNVSVWLLKNGDKVEYVAEHNKTISELEKQKPGSPDNPARVGLHSEVLIADQLYRRRDVLSGETLITQIFTERIPCSECRILLSEIIHFRDVPKYYYLAYHDKVWQRKHGGGSWGVFLMDCYRLRTTE
jgi:hypothetical protein